MSHFSAWAGLAAKLSETARAERPVVIFMMIFPVTHDILSGDPGRFGGRAVETFAGGG